MYVVCWFSCISLMFEGAGVSNSRNDSVFCSLFFAFLRGLC